MAERRTSHDPANRHRSPTLDNPQYHYESLDAALNAQPSSNSSRTRRRVTRTNSSGKASTGSASSSCVDGDRDGGKRSKSSRNTLKKTHRRDSAYSDISVGSHDSHGEERRDSAGFIPRLSQISEGRVSRATGGSEISSSSGSRSHRRRQYEEEPEEPEEHKRSRRRHGSSRRHGVSPTRSTLSSVASAPSEAASNSGVSTGSGTTPTKTSYRGDSVEEHVYQPTHRRRKTKRMSPTEVMEATEADVFQYMSESPQEATFTVEEAHDTPPSTSAPGSTASDSDAEGEEEQSSDSEDSHTGETPTTSPASMRRSHTDTPEESRHGYRAPKVPLYASSFVHGHGEEDEEEDESGEEGSDVQSEEDDDDESDVVHDDTSQHQALERTAPPAAPPIPAPNDPHTERLRQRERELANHVLQSPQPQKDFKFSGAPSPHPCQPMPLYSPRAYTAATPATYDATAGYPAEWPPFPPPLPISYPTQSSLESPTAGHPLPLTVQPPAGAPNVPPQQHVPQLHQYPGQPPPHYQAHVPTTDVTRTTVAGYELLASKLSEPSKSSKSPRKDRNIVPMYRKFEYLNHRVLLHLQDEICELEEELRELDECIVQMSPKNETGHAYPASRRGDAEYGSELHYKRTELLGRIFQKLGQYNQAFTSFNSLLKDVDPASPQDIQAYRAWMDKRSPINQVEARFLERRHDLLAVSRKGSSASPSRGAAQNPSAAVWGPMLLAVPLLAFAIVPSLVGRLLVIVLVGGVEGWLVMTTGELRGLMSGREWIMGGIG